MKNEAKRWLQFSQLVAPVKNMEEIFVLQPVLKKNLSLFLKIRLCFPEIILGKRLVELAKTRFFTFRKGGFGGQSGFGQTPLRW
jgi:hypothetical protein